MGQHVGALNRIGKSVTSRHADRVARLSSKATKYHITWHVFHATECTEETLLHPPLYSTLLYSTLLYSTLLYSNYSTLLYSTLTTLLYSTLLYSTLLYSRNARYYTPHTFLLVGGITDSGVSGRHGDGGDRQIDDVYGPVTGTHTASVLHRVDSDALQSTGQ